MCVCVCVRALMHVEWVGVGEKVDKDDSTVPLSYST